MPPADPSAHVTAAVTSPPAALEDYARAGALLMGLEIDDSWWPAVLQHLDVLVVRAASLDDGGLDLPEDPATVFEP